MEELKDKKFIIETLLELFTFVNWDRFIYKHPDLTAYGWIDREKDAYKDFFVVYLNIETQTASYLTSSAERHGDIEKIFKSDRQAKCERIEHYFKIKN